MTSLNNSNDIREACVKINTFIEKLQYIKGSEKMIEDWFQRRESLESFINQEQVTITVGRGERKEKHFISCIWARPEVRDGPDLCDCYFEVG